MGKRGQQLVKENYSVEMVALKMKELYEWILYGGEKPEFVYLKQLNHEKENMDNYLHSYRSYAWR